MSHTLGRIFGHSRKYSFRKAEQKFHPVSQSSVVTIHNLKSSRDDGILYPDDQLNDVADDREQIIAVFEENCSPVPPYNCGDVASTSSVCTGSPDLFSVEVGSHCSIPYTQSDVEITEDPHPSGVTPLQVRRGSEPALNCLFPVSPSTEPSKRWSTAVVINPTDPSEKSDDIHENGTDEHSLSPPPSLEINNDTKFSSLTFIRGSGRLSILGNNAETYRWVEAADRQLIKDFNENFTLKTAALNSCDLDAASDDSSMSDEREKLVVLKNENNGPLGIHVVPDYDSKGRDTGIVIQKIETGSRIDKDGRLRIGDRITEINGKSLQNVDFVTAQEIFKNALKAAEIKLELVRNSSHFHSKTAAVPKKPPPPVYPKTNNAENPKKLEEDAALVEGEERAGGISTKVATVTPTKKIPASATRRLASANTRRIGKMLTIELTKGPAGLGFSVTTRDNPAGSSSPIYIKNVLPKGAAIEDGRLQPGDRLLEVNGIPMTGKSQAEAVSILRNIPLGKAAQLIVSRQEVEESENADTESDLGSRLDGEVGIFPWKHREILTFQIPLTDSQSAGLGVSVKGKSTSTANGSVDLGIFIKSVIPGGAASKDGRLQTNDQLVNINGISLLNMSNSSAMETLRNAMTQSDGTGPIQNAIILTIARRIFHPSEGENENSNGPQKLENISAENTKNSPSPNVDDYNSIGKQNFHSDSYKSSQIISTVDNSQKPLLPGSNPVIERLTGQISLEKLKGGSSDIYSYCRHDVSQLPEDKNRVSYCTTLKSNQGETVIIEGEYDPVLRKTIDSHNQLNDGINLKDSSVAPASSQLSLDESNPGFARDGFGRQSMSEKRHAQLDARNTDTYQRTKKAREERDRSRQHFEQDYLQDGSAVSNTAKHVSESDEVVGPSLGLRKSSSLESLQTMIQELNKDDEAVKRALQAGTSRNARSRGCNESFRAAVDRSYDAPASTMETLDEESESGSSVGHMLARSVELADVNQNLNPENFQDDLLSMYCRNSKSSKKKSLLKGLGSVFKFGKNRKHSQEFKGKTEDEFTQDSDSVQTITSREQDRASDSANKENDLLKRTLPQIPRENASTSSLDSVPNRQERMQSLREQHQRMHQKRQGQYPLEQKEEFYENELKEKESKYALTSDVVHGRSHSLEIHKDYVHPAKVPAYGGDSNRYSHYMNYKEIQQHINQRVQHDHVHSSSSSSISKVDSKAPDKDPPLPPTFFEYENMHIQRHGTSAGSDISSNSLPRGAHTVDHTLARTQGAINKPYFLHDTHNHGNYGRMNVHHFYPSNKLYTHIVPGSKV